MKITRCIENEHRSYDPSGLQHIQSSYYSCFTIPACADFSTAELMRESRTLVLSSSVHLPLFPLKSPRPADVEIPAPGRESVKYF